jgi:acylpyruvate hydrolase
MMRLMSFGAPGAWRGGLEIDGTVYDLAAATAALGWEAPLASIRALLEQSIPATLEADVVALRDAPSMAGNVHGLESLHIGPPIPDPEKIICIGLNYHDHAEEVGAQPPDAPIFFAKYANSLVGPSDTIIPPLDTEKVDYEAELAVVIGKPGRYIDVSDALDHVAGAMVLNDVSARDLQLANQLWTGGKAIDTFAPCGPSITLTGDIDDFMNLRVQTRVGGTTLQDGNTKNMIFGVAECIAFLSRIMTLKPGDIIATGTPAGVAASHTPAAWLVEGDVVEVEFEGLGILRNPVGAKG